MNPPLDMYLSLQLMPEEGQGNMWIGCDLPPLTALIIAIEDKLPIQHFLEQDGTDTWATFGCRCADQHRRRLIHLGLDGLVEPFLHELKGILGQVPTAKAKGRILPTDIL
jgi:hypothetical protein